MDRSELATVLDDKSRIGWVGMPEGSQFWWDLRNYLKGISPLSHVRHPGPKPTGIPKAFGLDYYTTRRLAEATHPGSDVREHIFVYARLRLKEKTRMEELAKILGSMTNINWWAMPEGPNFWNGLYDYLTGKQQWSDVPTPGRAPTKIPEGFNLSEQAVEKIAKALPSDSHVRDHLFAYVLLLQGVTSFDETSDVQTRDGREACIFMVDDGRLIGAVKTGEAWHSADWDKNGDTSIDRGLSLVHKAKMYTFYLNIDTDGCVDVCKSREMADEMANSDRVARIRVDAEEGWFDE